MKTFKTLTEDLNTDGLIETIKNECSDFLRYRYPYDLLFRGIRGQDLDLGEIFKTQTRKRERPMSTPKTLNKIYDDLFSHFGTGLTRLNCYYATTNPQMASIYIDQPRRGLHLIIPVNGYNFVWSKEVRDLYGNHAVMQSISKRPYQDMFPKTKQLFNLIEDGIEQLKTLDTFKEIQKEASSFSTAIYKFRTKQKLNSRELVLLRIFEKYNDLLQHKPNNYVLIFMDLYKHISELNSHPEVGIVTDILNEKKDYFQKLSENLNANIDSLVSIDTTDAVSILQDAGYVSNIYLDRAMKSGNEIMFDGSFYAIEIKNPFAVEVVDELFPGTKNRLTYALAEYR